MGERKISVELTVLGTLRTGSSGNIVKHGSVEK